MASKSPFHSLLNEDTSCMAAAWRKYPSTITVRPISTEQRTMRYRLAPPEPLLGCDTYRLDFCARSARYIPSPYMWHLFHSCRLTHFLQVASQMLVHRPFPPETGQSSAGNISDGGCKPCVYSTSRMLLFVP